MFWSVVGFELRYAMRQPAFWLISGAYFLFALVYISSSVAGSALSSGAVHVNAPWAITRMVVHLSYLGILGVAAFAGSSIIRDEQTGVAGILFCTGLSKRDYVFGRFVGGFLAAMLSFSFVFVGLVIGHGVPWADARLLGPFPAGGLLAAYGMFAVPNVFIGSCVLFALALLTRETMKTYLGAVAILIGFVISRAFAGAFYATRDAQVMASLAEPFGAYAAMMAVLDWTPYERNTIAVWAQAYIVPNRVLWTAAGVALLLVAYKRFPFQAVAPGGRVRRRGEPIPPEVTPEATKAASADLARRARRLSGFEQLIRLAGFECGRILRGLPFRLILGLSCVGLLFWIVMYGQAYGTGFYPYTASLAEHIRSVFHVPLVAVLIFYAAELTWSARLQRVNPILDACPVSNAAVFFSKLIALVVVAGITLLCGIVTAAGYQLFRGFRAIEPWVYAVEVLVVAWPQYAVLAAFALTLQAVVRNRFVGMLAMVAVFVWTLVAPWLGIRSNLLIPGGRHVVHHNPMAELGDGLEPVVWFHGYWLLAAGLVSVVGLALWRRGEMTGWRHRWRAAQDVLADRWVGASAGVLLVGLASVALGIGYQTQIQNRVPTERQREAKAAAYERRYGPLRDLPQPKITRVEGSLRLYPATRHLGFDGSFRLVNRHDIPLDQVVLTARAGTHFARLHTERPGSWQRDRRHGVAQLVLARPLEPGDGVEIDLAVRSEPIIGFRNRATPTPVAPNGSIIFHNDFLPVVGYARGRELSDPLLREDHGLPERPSSVRAAGDPQGLAEREGQPYADWVSFDLSVSTEVDQSAIAQGALVTKRLAAGRAHYRYATRVPVKLHAGIVSGSYESVESVYAGQGGPVRISIHHMPGHGRNTAALMASLRRSLSTLEDAFGPYPYGRLRLIEVAMHHPTFRVRSDTLLADSSLGFINDPRLDDPRSPPSVLVKLPASMVANLYVQSIVMAANQPGAISIPDGLGFYLSGLVWSEQEHPYAIAETVRDTAWHYFTRRATADEPEGTIVDHVNQTHVGAHKHAVALYGLELYLGRERMIAAIRRFLDRFRFQGPPFATMPDLVATFRSEAPDQVQPIITDFFERRTLFDVAVTEASVEPHAEGYRVQAQTRVGKTYVSPEGQPREAAFDYPVPLVVFGPPIDRSGARQILARRMVSPEELADGQVAITVSQRPAMVGLDPFYRLLDRNYLDNRRELD